MQSEFQGAATAPVVNRIQKIPFDRHCIEQVAEALGATWNEAPFRLPGGAVFQITVPDKAGKPGVMLTIWPPLKRIDAISASSTIVFTDVVTVDLVGLVEVQFRRSNRDYLIVTRGGKVIVRA
jgi:hypothetical protein